MSRRLETVRLTANFKLDGSVPGNLFQTYKQILDELLDYACDRGISSFKRLKSEKYYDLRARYPNLPSHYIYTACQMSCSIYKTFRKLRRRGRAKTEKPFFKKNVILLDDNVFRVDFDRWEASIATEFGRMRLRILYGTYHERFKSMKVGQAWLVRRHDGCYLKAVFSKVVGVAEPNGKALAIDVNENGVAYGSEEKTSILKTGERTIRTAYFLKRRKLQSKLRLNEKPIMAKYRGREARRVEAIYHKVVNEIIEEAKGHGYSAIVLEDLKHIRKHMRKPRGLNGRLNRWSFRKLQQIIEYKAKFNGLAVVYVNAKGTSSLCPKCRVNLSPSGYRLMKCPECGLEEDRDIIAVRNLLQKYQTDVPSSSVQGESPPMTRGGKE
ncbi:MAG: transposase [Nitrososphaerota archaeon]|nr:transposase [Nitrososphaerota archaeon]